MAKILSFASWNVEHFNNDPDRLDRVVAQLAELKPDIFGIYEVRGKTVYEQFMQKLSAYSFMITERSDKSSMEILIGYRKSLNIFITHRDEFRSKVPSLRPGVLASIRQAGTDYSFLFLHLKSFTDPRSWGLRDDMFRHVASLQRAIDKVAEDSQGKLIVLGDLNTMGLSAAYNDICDLSPEQELAFLEKRFARVNLRRLEKSAPYSWWNGSPNYAPGSNLDHVFASDSLKFKRFGDQAQIRLIGWPEFTQPVKQKQWIERYSDHALLYGEIVD